MIRFATDLISPVSHPDPLDDRVPRAVGAPVSDPLNDAGGPVPDPFDDADALEELEEEIATLAAHIHAATHRLLTLVADFDRRRGWELGGHRTCAHWLHARTGIDLGAAREKVRAARALEGLPETSASMARGELSFSKVRALTRVATEANEGDLLELARGCTTAQLERMVRGFRRGSRADEAARERERHERRALSVFPDEDGMYVVKGLLPAEVGALLMRAVEAASDALYREERGPDAEADTLRAADSERDRRGPGHPETESQKAAAQRRADALGLLAERAMAAGLRPDPVSGTRAERYQVVLHVEPETLKAEGKPGRSELEDGTRVSAETSRRISCDSALVRIGHAPDGSVLDVGRRRRTIPPALRRALEARDGGCRFPGCGLRFAEGHHVTHWSEGGETSLGNCVLLCRFHHRLVHEGGWTVGWWGPGRAVFFDPRGGTHFDGRWQPPARGSASESEARTVEGEHPVPREASSLPREESPVEGERPVPREGHPAEASPLVEARLTLGSTLAERAHPPSEAGPVSAEHPVEEEPSLDEERVAEALIQENHRRGVSPDGWTAAARWKREADVPDPVYFRALEAMLSAEI